MIRPRQGKGRGPTSGNMNKGPKDGNMNSQFDVFSGTTLDLSDLEEGYIMRDQRRMKPVHFIDNHPLKNDPLAFREMDYGARPSLIPWFVEGSPNSG